MKVSNECFSLDSKSKTIATRWGGAVGEGGWSCWVAVRLVGGKGVGGGEPNLRFLFSYPGAKLDFGIYLILLAGC